MSVPGITKWLDVLEATQQILVVPPYYATRVYKGEARRIDGVVTMRKSVSTYTIHPFETVEAAEAFVESERLLAESKQKPELRVQAGVAAIWVDTVLDPKGTLDGKGGPVGWFDHDNWEADGGPTADVLARVSYSASFARAAVERSKELGADVGTRVDVLYGYAYTAQPGKNAKGSGWYLGTFAYDKKAGR